MDPVECDACLEEFVPKLTETRVKGGARQRLGCPGCGKIYEVAFVTTHGLKLRKDIDRARGGDPARFQQLLAEYQAEVSRPGDAAGSEDGSTES